MENTNKEVMENVMDEVITVVEMPPAKNFNGLKVVGTAAGVLAVGYGIYRGTKWVVGKVKAKKEQQEIEKNCEPTENVAD